MMLAASSNTLLINGRASAEFWREEYALNALIARYPKPYIAIMDGIVLGGGDRAFRPRLTPGGDRTILDWDAGNQHRPAGCSP